MSDYGDDNDYGFEGDGGDYYGDEREVFERTNKEYVDLKNPKDKFNYDVNEKLSDYDITDFDKKIIQSVFDNFNELQYSSYNVDGLLIGFVVYKNKSKKESYLKPLVESNKFSIFDIFRYSRLWEIFLNKK